MPILDVTERNLLLDCRFGPDRSALVTDEYSIELWTGDYRDDDAQEVTGGGYAAVDDDLDEWGPADGGETQKTADVDFVLTGPFDDNVSATHWVYRNTTSAVAAYCGELDEEFLPTGAGTFSFTPTLPWADPDDV